MQLFKSYYTKQVKSHDKIEIGVEGTCVITLDGV